MKKSFILFVVIFLMALSACVTSNNVAMGEEKDPFSSVSTSDEDKNDSTVKINQYDLTGKTIVNFGDSIFGNYSAPNDISTFIADKTNATVYNVGFGGCRMASHPTAKYDAFSMYNLADAVATGDFSKQDEAIKSHTSSNFTSCLTTLKSIDFSKVDIITIAYGTNDFEGAVSLSDYESALRHSIETISKAYPKIKIVLCTPIYRFWLDDSGNIKNDSDSRSNGQGYKLTSMCTKIKDIAVEYNIKVIDNYNNSGINATNGTKYLTDSVHPNTDGRKMIAENMAKELYKYFG